MFCITSGDVNSSQSVLAELVDFQTKICDDLGLHYRVLDMPTEELGSPAYRKYENF